MDRFIKEVSENWIGLAIINVYCLSLSVNAPLSVQLISLYPLANKFLVAVYRNPPVCMSCYRKFS